MMGKIRRVSVHEEFGSTDYIYLVLSIQNIVSTFHSGRVSRFSATPGVQQFSSLILA